MTDAGNTHSVPTAYALARYRSQAERLYPHLDNRLSDRTWIAAEGYCIADIAVYPWSNYLEQYGFRLHADPALTRWRAGSPIDPAVKRAAARFSAAFDQESRGPRRTATPAQLDRFFGRSTECPLADDSSVTRD